MELVELVAAGIGISEEVVTAADVSRTGVDEVAATEEATVEASARPDATTWAMEDATDEASAGGIGTPKAVPQAISWTSVVVTTCVTVACLSTKSAPNITLLPVVLTYSTAPSAPSAPSAACVTVTVAVAVTVAAEVLNSPPSPLPPTVIVCRTVSVTVWAAPSCPFPPSLPLSLSKRSCRSERFTG